MTPSFILTQILGALHNCAVETDAHNVAIQTTSHSHTHSQRDVIRKDTTHTRIAAAQEKCDQPAWIRRKTDGRTDRQCCQLIAQLGAAGKRCGNGGQVAMPCGERDRERERPRERVCVCVCVFWCKYF